MQIDDQGVVSNFLGMQNQMKDGTSAISHGGYISKLLEKLNMSDCKIAKDPMSKVQFDEYSKSFLLKFVQENIWFVALLVCFNTT